MVDNTEDQSFLSRWSRRKQQQTCEPAGVKTPPSVAPVSVETEDRLPVDRAGGFTEVQSPAQLNDQTDAQLQQTAAEQPPLTDADMPPIESLDSNSDYSPFLSEGVSKELRNMALKKLFFSGKFALRDGLDDYDDDFTRFEPLGNTVTSDMKFHQRRKERERLAKLEEEKRLEEEQKALENNAHNNEEQPADTDDPLQQEVTDASDNTNQPEVTGTQPDSTDSQSESQTTQQHSPPLLTDSEQPSQSGDTVTASGKLKRRSTGSIATDTSDHGETT